MDLGRAFGFVMEDENWLNKILIGGLILIIPVFGQIALLGYMLDVARNVAQGNPRPLPDWSDLGNKFMKGLYMLVIGLVYALPVIILIALLAFVAILIIGVTGGESDAAAGLAGLLLFCIYPLAFILGLFVQLLVFAGYTRYIQTDSLGTALQFSETWNMVRATPGRWVVLLLVNILCGIVGSVGSIACGIGILFTLVYSQAVFGHVLGQVVAQMGGVSGYGAIPPGGESPVYQ